MFIVQRYFPFNSLIMSNWKILYKNSFINDPNPSIYKILCENFKTIVEHEKDLQRYRYIILLYVYSWNGNFSIRRFSTWYKRFTEIEKIDDRHERLKMSRVLMSVLLCNIVYKEDLDKSIVYSFNIYFNFESIV